MAGNADIRKYFQRASTRQKPVVAAAAPEPPAIPVNPTPVVLYSQEERDPLSSPSSKVDALSPSPSPSPIKLLPARRLAEIRDSDDGDSDDSLPDVDEIWTQHVGPSRTPPKERRCGDSCVTPKAKRSALFDPTTPLTVRTKHKYDMTALRRFHEEDEAAEASHKRVTALLSQPDSKNQASPSAISDAAGTLEDTLGDFSGDEEDDASTTKEKLKRAIKRTEAAASQKSWYFFRQESDPFAKRPATTTTNNSWPFGGVKSEHPHLSLGFTQNSMSPERPLPDEVVVWILDQIPYERSKDLRTEYVAVVTKSPPTLTRSLMDEDRIKKFFASLGSVEDVYGSSKLKPVVEIEDPYPLRDWSHLISVLRLLAGVSIRKMEDETSLTFAAILCAVKLLLRLGIDGLVVDNVDVSVSYQDALESLLESVENADWNDLCYAASKSIYQFADAARFQWQALSHVEPTTRRLHDFRRRLAAVFFLGDPSHARRRLEDSLDLDLVIARVKSQVLQGSHNQGTDYQELAAMLLFLDIIIDDGVFNEDGDHQDHRIDELGKLIGTIWRKISATGTSHKLRLESKNLSKWIPDRLQYSFRSRRRIKDSIYEGTAVAGRQEDDRQLQIKQYLQSIPSPTPFASGED